MAATTGLFETLTEEELQELITRLDLARDRAMDLAYTGLDNEDHKGSDDPRYKTFLPVYFELDSAYMVAYNERNTRNLGCRWSACAVCAHTSCGFCPACNSGQIAPNGEAYDDTSE